MNAVPTDEPLEIPAQFETMDPKWMTRALRDRGLLSTGQVESVGVERIGEGEGFMCVVARLRLTYLGDANYSNGQPLINNTRSIHPNTLLDSH